MSETHSNSDTAGAQDADDKGAEVPAAQTPAEAAADREAQEDSEAHPS